jgi:methionine sulfoxide reductase heme-binding subunit
VQDFFTAAGHATGLVGTILLTATTVVGMLHSGRVSSTRWPRFAMHAVHRNVSLLALVFVLAHVTIAVGKPRSGLVWFHAVLPYSCTPHPLWLGVGVVALELMAAAIVTSFLRARIGRRVWRAVHVMAYASWPFAIAHGVGIGSDRGIAWVVGVYVACVLAVVAALGRRFLTVDPDRDARRAARAGQR